MGLYVQLQSELAAYKVDLMNATTAQERSDIRNLITATSGILLMLEQNQPKPIDASLPFKLPWGIKLGDVSHVAGTIFTVASIVGAGLVMKNVYQRATNKFFNSLISKSKSALGSVNKNYISRKPIYTERGTIEELDLLNARKPIVFIGDNRSGKSTYISNYILKKVFPWWNRFFFPPRGFYLLGNRNAGNVKEWLQQQISTTTKDDPWQALDDLLRKRYNEQWVRIFLQNTFGSDALPWIMKPQPAIIVIDQAEELLRSYRSHFLYAIYDIVRAAERDGMVRLVLIVNTEHAVNSLKCLNGGNLFQRIQAPKVSREEVVEMYGDDFARIFDACDSCIGTALMFWYDDVGTRDLTQDELQSKAKAYSVALKKQYMERNCLDEEISGKEFDNAGKKYTL